jgi:hypothetical protein
MKRINRIGVTLLIILPMIAACSGKNSGIDIRLTENQHLEQTEAGWWLKEIAPHERKQASYLTRAIHDRLTARAALVDQYQDDRDNRVTVWKWPGEKGAIILEESNYDSAEGPGVWITFRYPPPGIPWREVIPNDYNRLPPNRQYENAVVIHSTADGGARLFLFGWGDYCTHISVF